MTKAKPCNCGAYKYEHNLDDTKCRILYNDDIEIDENPDDGWCASCSGTGEGQYDGTRCMVCKGSGVTK